MNTIGENNTLMIYNVSKENFVTSDNLTVESKKTLDDTAAILNLSTNSYEDGIVTQKSLATTRTVSYASIVNAQNYLRTFGLYSGSNTGYVSSDMRESIRNFQRIYGMAETGSLTDNVYEKIVEVYNEYISIYNSSALSSIANHSEFQLDAIEKKNFALIWTFLDKSMGLTGEQIVGVMANIRAESKYSSDNLQGVESEHDTDYVYKVSDGKGYGILQWTYQARKEGLLDMAETMGLNVSDINSQLAYFRKEMTTSFNDLNYVDSWNNLLSTNNYLDACDVFLEEIESPNILNYEERRNYATIIYNIMNEGGFIS